MIDRRRFLNGVTLGAGGTVLHPMIGQLLAEAEGRTSPLRFVFVVEGNGLNPPQIQPTNIKRHTKAGKYSSEKLEDLSFGREDLPPALEPLADFTDRMTVIQGLSGRVCGGGHSNNFGALGIYSSKAGAIGQTIDSALGEAVPGIFSQFNFGISTKPEHSVIYNCSASGPGTKIPTQCRPDLAYNTLFGSVAKGEGAARFAANRDLLDFMTSDVKRVKREIGSADAEKLDSYLGAFENLRQRQDRLVEVRDKLSKIAPVPDDKFKSPVETDRLDSHFDLAAAALIGRLTNVITIASGCGDPYFGIKFSGLGIGIGKHGIGHGGGFEGQTWDQLAVKIRRFHLGLTNRLMHQLAAVPEGDGTMLDNTLIVYMSDAAESHHSRCWEWPFLILGDLGGKLKSGQPGKGRYLGFPKYGEKGHRVINGLYNTFLHVAGSPRDNFGHEDIGLKDLDQRGPLSELLA